VLLASRIALKYLRLFETEVEAFLLRLARFWSLFLYFWEYTCHSKENSLYSNESADLYTHYMMVIVNTYPF
jgi:hypothetical protein